MSGEHRKRFQRERKAVAVVGVALLVLGAFLVLTEDVPEVTPEHRALIGSLTLEVAAARGVEAPVILYQSDPYPDGALARTGRGRITYSVPALNTLTEERIHYLVLHEMAHYLRGDDTELAHALHVGDFVQIEAELRRDHGRH